MLRLKDGRVVGNLFAGCDDPQAAKKNAQHLQSTESYRAQLKTAYTRLHVYAKYLGVEDLPARDALDAILTAMTTSIQPTSPRKRQRQGNPARDPVFNCLDVPIG